MAILCKGNQYSKWDPTQENKKEYRGKYFYAHHNYTQSRTNMPSESRDGQNIGDNQFDSANNRHQIVDEDWNFLGIIKVTIIHYQMTWKQVNT